MALAGLTRRLKSIRLVKSPEARSRTGQLFFMGRAFMSRGFTPLECYLYEFFLKSSATRDYVSRRWIENSFRPALNSRRYLKLLKNKLVFSRFYARKKLPVLGILGLFHPSFGFSVKGGGLKTGKDLKYLLQKIRTKRIVAKPPCSIGGKGMMVVEQVASGKLLDIQTEQEITFERLHERLLTDIATRQPREDSCTGYLLQPYLSPQPSLNPLKGRALNTLRIATLRDIDDNIYLDFGMIRIARPGAVTDNMHRGGMVASVEVNTGEISPVTYGFENETGPWLEKKPADLGSYFKKRLVPKWKQMTEMVKEFHSETPGLNSIGWDVTLSKHGPVVIEGNDNWDMIIAQVIEGGYLTPRRRKILSQYGVKLPGK